MNPVPWLQMTNMISYQGLVRTFPSLGASSSNTWDIINTSCSYGQMPSSLELAQRPSGGVVPRKVGTLWGEYGNLKTYGNAFSSTDYWTSTQLMGVHEKFNPETALLNKSDFG